MDKIELNSIEAKRLVQFINNRKESDITISYTLGLGIGYNLSVSDGKNTEEITDFNCF